MKPFTNTPAEFARELFNAHYIPIFDSDTDASEECIVSLLAIQEARVTIMTLMSLCDDNETRQLEFLVETNKELGKL